MSIELTRALSNKKAKSLNSQIYTMVCNRLKLKRREASIFYRLLGFLIRNEKPFPYSIKSLSENTKYSPSSIHESLNILQKLRLIERIGFTSNVKFMKGSILVRICSLLQKRTKNNLYKNSPLLQKLEKISPASPVSGYNKTYYLLKHKEEALSVHDQQQIKFYTSNNFPIPEEENHIKSIIEEKRKNKSIC